MVRDGASGRVVVVGGGAAGLVAAIAAASRGAAVTILERLPRVGRKILATGNGRCNLANARLAPERFHGEHPGFPATVLARFGLDETLDFFRRLGIEPREEAGGKIFPRSGQASSVLDVLRHELARLGVESRCGARATALRPLRPGGWEVATPDGAVGADALVVAPGGRAAPQLGSDGSGLELLAALGHRIVEPFPALTRIRLRSPWLRRLKGAKVEGSVTIREDGRAPLARAEGEVLFTESGISGPPVLDLSRLAGALVRRGRRCTASLDLAPELDEAPLAELVAGRLGRGAEASAEFALVGFLPGRLIVPVLRDAGVAEPAGPAAAARDAAPRLAATLKRWSFPVTGTDSWTDAQVTAGGVDTRDVDPGTLASLAAPALFLAGEVLDVDGDCGGFNLQWAWSSGHVAGEGAAAAARCGGAA